MTVLPGAGTGPPSVDSARGGLRGRATPPLSVVSFQERHSGRPKPKTTWPAEILTPAEVDALVSACSARAATGIRNRALLMLLYRSGLRISEALALRPGDLDFERHSIRVLRGKGAKATTRGFHPSCDDALHRWLDTRRARGLRGPLFCTLKGGPVWDSYVRTLLPRLARRAGVERRVHAHALRHTYAVELERAGMTVTEISKLLGHSSPAVTARYLDHLSNRQAIDALVAAELPVLKSMEAAS